MSPKLSYLYCFIFMCLLINQSLFASSGGGSMSEEEIKNVSKTDMTDINDIKDQYNHGKK